jgi:hypothetical protein
MRKPTFDFSEIPDENDAEEDPFGQTVEAEILTSDFVSSIEEPMPAEVNLSAIDSPANAAVETPIEVTDVAVEVDQETGDPTAMAVPADAEAVESLLNAADEAIRHLESALDAAHRQRDALRMMFGR